MEVYSAAQVAERLPYKALIEGLRKAFCQDIEVPQRLMYSINRNPRSDAALGLMTAWCTDLLITKVLTIFPDNLSYRLPTIHAQIMAFDGKTGVPAAIIDGTEVTRRRTAATSALAASYLAIEQAEYLVVVGTGPQALHQALAHSQARPIGRIGVWGRNREKAESLVDHLGQSAVAASLHVIDDLEQSARKADVISCATSAIGPIVLGEWLKPGCFLDLVGSHTADRRECDDEAVRRSRIYVDSLAGALTEAGDLLSPLERRVIRRTDIRGDLRDLCRGEVAGRGDSEEVTLFKSVGSAIEDLAAARMVLEEVYPRSKNA